MLLVGLTGGIASGKTQVRRIFEEMGARTIDADEVSRELVAAGTPALSRIGETFGHEFLLPGGSLDRKKLAEVIFADEEKRRKLEAILHPLIGDEIASRIEKYSQEDPQAVIVVDAALLIEIGSEGDFDKLVVVYADEDTRIERLMARDGLTRHEAYRRVLAQMPLESKLELADYVINNCGALEETRREAMKVFNRLRRLAGK